MINNSQAPALISVHLSNPVISLKSSESNSPDSSKSSLFHWKAGSINVRTMHDDVKTSIVMGELKRARIDIAALQEVRRSGTDNALIGDYRLYWCGYKRTVKGENRQAGVALAIRNIPQIKVESVESVGPRLITADLIIGGMKIKVVSAYGPTEMEKSLSYKDDFWRNLKKHTVTSKRQQLLLLGDFNSTTSSVACKATNYHGQYVEDQKNNDNGHRLIRFLAEFQYSVLNTYYRHKPSQSFTWYSNTGKLKKILDLQITTKFLQRFCKDCRVRTSYDFHSDHRLVISQFSTPTKRSDMKTRKFYMKSTKIDFKNICNQTKTDFLTLLDENLENNQSPTDIEIISLIKEASRVLPTRPKPSQKSFPWDDDMKLKDLLVQRRNYHIRRDRSDYRRLTKMVKKRVKQLKNEHFKSEAEKINFAVLTRDMEKAYAVAKQQASAHVKKPKQTKCDGLSQFFKAHFNPDHSKIPTPISLQKPHPYREPTNVDESTPKREEIIESISKLRNQKSSIDIPGELVKLAISSEQFVETIHNFYSEIWEKGEVPDTFGKGEISALFKNKGSMKDPSKYRGITLSTILSKILVNILLARLNKTYDGVLYEGQMGFRPNRGCNDGIYCLKRLHQWARKNQIEIYVGMVDLSAAFDHISRPFLMTILRMFFGENSTIIKLIESMYSKTECNLKGDKASFQTTSGVRQGGTESPTCYNLYADHVMEVFCQRCEEAGIRFVKIPFKIPGECSDTGKIAAGLAILKWLGYADDLGLSTLSKTELNTMLNILDEVFKSYCLKMNPDKTETLILNWKLGKGNPDEYPKSIVTIGDEEINNTKSFKYLGAKLEFDNSSTGTMEIENRITAATCKFFELKNFFRNYGIELQTRCKFLEALVRSKLTYGCQSWCLTKTQSQKIDSSYIGFQRHIVRGGTQKLNEVLSHTNAKGETKTFKKYRLKNEKIVEICNRGLVSEFIGKMQKKWISHCVRDPDQ